MLPERKNFLEIGSYEGRSAVWIVENMLEDGGKLCCIDTWEGGEEHKAAKENMGDVQKTFLHNIEILKGQFPERRIEAYKGTSTRYLAELICNSDERFDFIYIDGSHTARDVLTDACMAWPVLKPGGIMVFDDYMWGDARDTLHRPKIAIDMFATIFAEELAFVHFGYQLAVRKIR
jgi:predicted O-methyltransferase YrrM